MTTLAQWLVERVPTEIQGVVPIYQQVQRITRSQDVGTLAGKFGIDRKPEDAGDIYVVSKAKKVLIAHKAGPTFYFLDCSKMGNPEYRPELPSQDEAREAALHYLKEEGLLPNNAVVAGVH